MSALCLADVRLPTVEGDADALLVREGRIASIGRWSELRGDLPAGTEVRDLAGASALPGLGDAHVHFTATGYLQTAVDCSGAATLDALLDRVASAAARKAPGELVLGLRLEHLEFPRKRVPTLDELSAAAPDNPVYLRHITGHSSVANAQTLALLDFPPGQLGVRLGVDGRPDGYLVAQATQLATQQMYARYSAEVGYEAAFRAAAARAAAAGCTVVHALDDLEAVRTLLAVEPTLPVRVLPYAQSFDLDAVAALGLPRIGGCHGCALDGDFDMHTAALLDGYRDRPGHFGVLYHDDVSLESFVRAAHARGMQLCFHAVGDRAVEQALGAFAKAQHRYPRPDPRHRVEHGQLMSASQMERASGLGVVMSVQPAFNHVWDHHTYDEWVGERALEVDPLASLARHGLRLAGGSDSTVTELRPLLGVHAAVNHSRPEERLSVADALAMFSEGVAYGTFDEGRRGRVAVGYDADLTVVGDDPFAIDPAAIGALSVVMTVTRGRVVYEA